MEQSTSLTTAHIQFIDDRVSLIHIPLESYVLYVHPLLQLLQPVKEQGTSAYDSDGNASSSASSSATLPWANQHPFLNISITPIECSVICSKSLAQQYFAPLIFRQPQGSPNDDHGRISTEDFVVISVEGEGLEAGQRVLELTSPLAMAGISIFFITTYFSDYILVPARTRAQVIQTLEARGFAFQKTTSAYINVNAHHHQHQRSGSSPTDFHVPPLSPPPASITDLQTRTFQLLHRHNIHPIVHRDIRLIHCASHDSPHPSSPQDLALQLGLTRCLINPPRFLSLTLVRTEPASLLLEPSSLSLFGAEDDVLLGRKEAFLIPITLNLESLPLEATGIICGVADRLAGEGEGIEMTYLSTARAGTVMVEEGMVGRAEVALGVE